MLKTLNIRLRCTLVSIVMTLLVMTALVVWFWSGIEYLPAVEMSLYAKDRVTAPAIDTSISPRLTEITRPDVYSNINGRTLIRVPDWVVELLGDYYLYFSHHKGDHLRLAYANHPNGPWTLYEAGVFALEDFGFLVSDVPQCDPVDALMSTVSDYSISVSRDIVMAIYQSLVTAQQQRKVQSVAMAATTKAHIASPEIVVDNNHRQIVMFYHGQDDILSQSNRVALSHNGIDFRV